MTAKSKHSGEDFQLIKIFLDDIVCCNHGRNPTCIDSQLGSDRNQNCFLCYMDNGTERWE